MSGGYFDYKDSELLNSIFNYESKPYNALEDAEFSLLVWDVLQVIHTFDYYKSGDCGEERYLKAKDAFKKTWFGRGARKKIQKQIIDQKIEDLKQELYKTYDIREDIENEPGRNS